MRALLLLMTAVSIVAQEVSIEDAMRMAASGGLSEAESALNALSAKNPREADLKYRLGLILVKEKKLDEASRVLKEVTQMEPSVFAWLALGDVCLQRGDRAGAADSAKRAQRLLERSFLLGKRWRCWRWSTGIPKRPEPWQMPPCSGFQPTRNCCACEVSRGTAWAESTTPSHLEYVLLVRSLP